MTALWFVLNAFFAALNLGFYVELGHWWNLAAGIFSAAVAAFFLVAAARELR